MGKGHILAEIKRLAQASGGTPPGQRAFERETSIKRGDWFPDLWLNWGEALEEAGFARNIWMKEPVSDEFMLEQYARLAQRLKHLPVVGELLRESKASKTFPHDTTYRERFGDKAKLLEAIAAFCRTHAGFDEVLAMCEGAVRVESNDAVLREVRKTKVATGFVYLIKSGPHHKIGHTNSVARRGYELGIKIPVPPRTVHYIETDDPVGIGAYWHKRFDSKRGEGEWFNLTADDVAAFKRWKRIF